MGTMYYERCGGGWRIVPCMGSDEQYTARTEFSHFHMTPVMDGYSIELAHASSTQAERDAYYARKSMREAA